MPHQGVPERDLRLHAGGRRAEPQRPVRHPLLRGRVLPRGRHRMQPPGLCCTPNCAGRDCGPDGCGGTAGPARKGRPALPRAGRASATPGPATAAVPTTTRSAGRGPRPRPAAAAARPASSAAGSRSATTGSAARRTARGGTAARTAAAAVAAIVSRANAATTASASATRKVAPMAAATPPAPASREPRTRPAAASAGPARRARRDRAASTRRARPATRHVPARLLCGGSYLPAGQRLPALRRAGRGAVRGLQRYADLSEPAVRGVWRLVPLLGPIHLLQRGGAERGLPLGSDNGSRGVLRHADGPADLFELDLKPGVQHRRRL